MGSDCPAILIGVVKVRDVFGAVEGVNYERRTARTSCAY